MGQKRPNQNFQKFNSKEMGLLIILAPILMIFDHFSKSSMIFNMGLKRCTEIGPNRVWQPVYPHIENHAGFRKVVEFHQNRRQNERKTHLFRIEFL